MLCSTIILCLTCCKNWKVRRVWTLHALCSFMYIVWFAKLIMLPLSFILRHQHHHGSLLWLASSQMRQGQENFFYHHQTLRDAKGILLWLVYHRDLSWTCHFGNTLVQHIVRRLTPMIYLVIKLSYILSVMSRDSINRLWHSIACDMEWYVTKSEFILIDQNLILSCDISHSDKSAFSFWYISFLILIHQPSHSENRNVTRIIKPTISDDNITILI